MQNHVLPYWVQFFEVWEEKGVRRRVSEQQVAEEKNESREADARAGLEANTV